MAAFAESDTCDNASCPRGANEPATWTLTVEQFDEGLEEHYDRIFRACSACNRSCKQNFMGHRIKARTFDNSTRNQTNRVDAPLTCRTGPVPGSASYACEHPANATTTTAIDVSKQGSRASEALKVVVPAPHASAPLKTPPIHGENPLGDSYHSLNIITALQNSLHVLNERPPTPALFVAGILIRHNASCSHPVDSCQVCSHRLLCCSCSALFAPAVSRHLSCAGCKHVASTCCTTAFCCKCRKLWLPTDSVFSACLPARRFYGGAGSNSSPELDIWTPSPRSSPDEIDDLTARANIPLPTSRPESDASRVPSHASSIDEPVNVAATPLPTPDFSSLTDDAVDGLIHPGFPDCAILDTADRHHFLGHGDLSVTSLKLYARRIFTETSHWITAGHFLVDIFQASLL